MPPTLAWPKSRDIGRSEAYGRNATINFFHSCLQDLKPPPTALTTEPAKASTG